MKRTTFSKNNNHKFNNATRHRQGVLQSPPVYGIQSIDKIAQPESAISNEASNIIQAKPKTTSSLMPPAYGITVADHPSLIQPKLTIGSVDDNYEREADSMADHIVQQSSSSLAQTRRCNCEQKACLQRKEASASSSVSSSAAVAITAPARISQQIQSTGSPLSESTRTEMQGAFGTDFSHVRIHTDHRAIGMNRALHARAFTHRSDIYFNQGEYNPGTKPGKHLLAHELTHVVQQRRMSPRIQRDLAIEPPNPQAEVSGLLQPAEVSAALHFNLDRFANAEELRVMRDVLGLATDVRHLIDEEFVQTVAGWQASHNLADIDGKLGPNTVRSIVAEYRAEARLVPSMTGHANRLAIRTRPNQRATNIDVNGHNDLFDALLSEYEQHI